MYRRVLLAGARSVEIAVHGGGAGPEVGGFADSERLPLGEVLAAISECAFVASDLPLFISLAVLQV